MTVLSLSCRCCLVVIERRLPINYCIYSLDSLCIIYAYMISLEKIYTQKNLSQQPFITTLAVNNAADLYCI